MSKILGAEDAEGLLRTWNFYSKSDTQRLAHSVSPTRIYGGPMRQGEPEMASLWSSPFLQKLLPPYNQGCLLVASSPVKITKSLTIEK